MTGSSDDKILLVKKSEKSKLDSNLNTKLQPISLNNIVPKQFLQLQSNLKAKSKSVTNNARENLYRESAFYGELIVLGHNGQITNPRDSRNPFYELIHSNRDYSVRRKSKFVLQKRSKPNGVKPDSQHYCNNGEEVNKILKNAAHSVTYTVSRNQTIVVEYSSDENVDMFQIGRSSDSAIDFIVLDTIPANELAEKTHPVCKNESTVSRYACRITVERVPPYRARIYAAGFDLSNNIFLGDKAIKWTDKDGKVDGLTTNGILISHPSSLNMKKTKWAEVSICGAVFESHDNKRGKKLMSKWTNELQDGTLIDICGATLIWRNEVGLGCTPTKRYLEKQLDSINKLKPQCPVSLQKLVFPTSLDPKKVLNNNSISNKMDNSNNDEIGTPVVYFNCGHVQGQHGWGAKDDKHYECPVCRTVGPYAKLTVSIEPSLYLDDIRKIDLIKPYAFIPCGHMASEDTCKYWSKIIIPASDPMCPFCAIKLDTNRPFVKLIFS